MTAPLRDLSGLISKRTGFSSPILACGGHLKNTFALSKGDKIFVSEPNGDLEDLESLAGFERDIEHFKQLFDITPQIIAYDLHPEYLSTKYARELARSNPRLLSMGVGHHHAHIASCLADNKVSNREVIGVAFDGTGFGTDGNIWGSEFLIADYRDAKRAAHLKYIPLPGGDKAIKEPWRMAATYLYEVFGPGFLERNLDFVSRLDKHKWKILQRMIERGINCPFASSMGRLFDAVSSLAGVRDTITYEGEAAIELEKQIVKGSGFKVQGYGYEIKKENQVYIIEPGQLIKEVVEDLGQDVPVSVISEKFHNSVVEMVVDVCERLEKETGLNEVALSGGVFQNRFLINKVPHRLKERGFKVYTHNRVPANDSSISLGQLMIAGARG